MGKYIALKICNRLKLDSNIWHEIRGVGQLEERCQHLQQVHVWMPLKRERQIPICLEDHNNTCLAATTPINIYSSQ